MHILLATLMLTLLGMGRMEGAEADKLLTDARARLSAESGIAANFTMTQGGNRTTGSLTMQGSRFVLTMPELEVWFDGTTQWSLSRKMGDVNISTPDDRELAQINPLTILGTFSKDYTARMLKSTDGRVVELNAKSKSAEIRRAVVTLNSRTLLPSKIVLTPSSGAAITITVSKIGPAKSKPTAATFRFDPARHPGIEVIDLR